METTTRDVPRSLKLTLLTLWALLLAALLYSAAACDMLAEPVADAQVIADNAASMAASEGLDPANLTPEQAEHYVELAAQAWATEQHEENGWKYWAGTAIQILLGGNAGLALLTGRGRTNLGTLVGRDSSTRERVGSALAILIGTHTPNSPPETAPTATPPTQ